MMSPLLYILFPFLVMGGCQTILELLWPKAEEDEDDEEVRKPHSKKRKASEIIDKVTQSSLVSTEPSPAIRDTAVVSSCASEEYPAERPKPVLKKNPSDILTSDSDIVEIPDDLDLSEYRM
ncbi:MAG: hypothetical protein Q7S87_08940 [Agitococcus sp.]|nr:hypothetical protein [Agitococcus sp.]MDO9177026.1 hypothetical protein [Agitococcus sp.]